MAVSKVIALGETLIDLTGDTVNPSVLLKGYTAHSKDGLPIEGSLESGSSALEDFLGGFNSEEVKVIDGVVTDLITINLKDSQDDALLDSSGRVVEANIILRI